MTDKICIKLKPTRKLLFTFQTVEENPSIINLHGGMPLQVTYLICETMSCYRFGAQLIFESYFHGWLSQVHLLSITGGTRTRKGTVSQYFGNDRQHFIRKLCLNETRYGSLERDLYQRLI